MKRPVVWTVAGSDSGGGAGIQADLKTMSALGVHGCSAVTAMTAQNPRKVLAVQLSTPEFLLDELLALDEELPPSAVKTGMLGTAALTSCVAEFFSRKKMALVCDPVLVATSGARLTDEETHFAYRDLFRLSEIVTPNLPEAQVLAEGKAERFLEWGARSVLIKGGHGISDFATDLFIDEKAVEVTSPRQPIADTHGTGCTLAAAIASALACEKDRLSSVVLAKTYLNRALRLSYSVGNTTSLYHDTWPLGLSPQDLPWLGQEARAAFPDCGKEALGFYPIVDKACWIAPFADCGVTTIQLRIKDLHGAELDTEINHAIRDAQKHGVRLFINDFWEQAIRYGAYGVHLGQEDLSSADVDKIRHSGLRLGISTHSFAELARARALRPSYVALGPIFPTKLKIVPFAPQGFSNLRLWRQLVDIPLVAIGGITLNRVEAVAECGANGIAVVNDVMSTSDPVSRAKQYVSAIRGLCR